MDTNQEALDARLDVYQQQILERQDVNRQALKSQLTDHHQQCFAIGEGTQRRISEIQVNQARFSSRQEHLIRTSKQTEKRTNLLIEQVQSGIESSSNDHQKTRGLLIDGFEKLEIALSQKTLCAKQSGNDVYFGGNRPDMIMAYLLPIKHELDIITQQVSAQSLQGIPIQEFFALREEFKRLLGSAAQEDAAQYSMSTATSFDQWHFPGGDSELMGGHNVRKRKCGERIDSENEAYNARKTRKRVKLKKQTAFFKTNSGELRFSITRENLTGNDTQNVYDLDLSFSNRVPSFTMVNILFARSLIRQARSQICTQLNVFTPIPGSHKDAYWFLSDNPTIQDIDQAIRQGSISPYHIRDTGTHPILYVSISISAENLFSCLS